MPEPGRWPPLGASAPLAGGVTVLRDCEVAANAVGQSARSRARWFASRADVLDARWRPSPSFQVAPQPGYADRAAQAVFDESERCGADAERCPVGEPMACKLRSKSLYRAWESVRLVRSKGTAGRSECERCPIRQGEPLLRLARRLSQRLRNKAAVGSKNARGGQGAALTGYAWTVPERRGRSCTGGGALQDRVVKVLWSRMASPFRFRSSLLSALIVACVPNLAAQYHVTSWGAVRVDTRWFGRNDVLDVATCVGNTAVLRADGSVDVIGNTLEGVCDVPSLPTGMTYTSIALCRRRAVAMRSDGQLVRWGDLTSGTPVLPQGVTFTEIRGGYEHFLGLRSDGEVVAWGSTSFVPNFAWQVPVVQMAVGNAHSLVRRSDGSVIGWGNLPVPSLPPGVHYTDIAAGYGHSLFLRSDQQIVALGDDSYGQCNVPSLPAGVGYSRVWAGAFYSIALRTDGQLVAWGDNRTDQLDLPALPAGGAIARIHAGYYHVALARTDGRLTLWGGNSFGECNIPEPPPGVSFVDFSAKGTTFLGLRSDGLVEHLGERGFGGMHLVPMPPSGVVYTAVAAGRSHCLAVRSDGQVVAWGANHYGQCNVPALPVGVDYVAVATGNDCSLALRSDGTIACWGLNQAGLFSVPALPPGVTYRRLAVGSDHALALRSDGEVVAWGDGSSGETQVPTLPAGLQYARIAAGVRHSLVWRTDGRVLAFGGSVGGQLNVPSLPADRTYTEIAAEGDHGLAARSDGAVVGWGNNLYGQRNVPSLPTGYSYSGLHSGVATVLARVAPAGTHLRLGTGCAGSMPVSSLVPYAVPRVGESWRMYLTNLPTGFALLCHGWNSTTSPLGPLPYSLSALGMPGCSVFLDPQAIVLVGPSAGTVHFEIDVPNWSGLQGLLLLQQAVVLDPGAGNALGFALSHATSAVIGG